MASGKITLMNTVEVRGGPFDENKVSIQDYVYTVEFIDSDKFVSYRADIELEPIAGAIKTLSLNIHRSICGRLFVQWPIKTEDKRYCFVCACPIAYAKFYIEETVGVSCRKDHTWSINFHEFHKKYPKDSWPSALRKEYDKRYEIHYNSTR